MDKAEQLRNLLSKRVVFLDGATGTELMKRGLPPGDVPEIWALEHPEIMTQIHKDYLLAGADILLTNTFGANKAKIGSESLAEKVNTAMAIMCLEIAGDKAFAAASMGPTGKVIYPAGDLRVKEAYDIFYHQARVLASAGINIFFLETFSDIRELKAAVLAVRDAAPHAFISMQMTFEQGGRSLSGTDPMGLALLAEQLDVDAVGTNCSMGPEGLLPVFQELSRVSTKFLVVEPNAGLPVNGQFRMGPEEFASWAEDFAWAGANIIGGCCGTGPGHVKEFVKLVGKREPAQRESESINALSSLDRLVILGTRTLPVGESINPTGKKALLEAIKKGDIDKLVSLAREQERAEVLDVNLGLERVIPQGFVRELFAHLASGPPLSVDLSTPSLIEEAFWELGGIGILNSLTAMEEDIASKIEILKRHGGYAVLLPLDEKGLGETPDERLKKIQRGLSILEEHGFPKNRVIADPIVKPVATGADFAITIETLEKLKRLGLLTIAGVSNVSHGLPGRRGLNAAALVYLAEKGLDLAIIDVGDRTVMESLMGCQVLLGKAEPVETEFDVETEGQESDPAERLINSLITGNKHKTIQETRGLLGAGMAARDVLDRCLAPAMERVGKLYESKKIFLPHLVASADAAEAMMGVLKPLLQKAETPSAGVVVIATVKGDVHDIGKNLVALFLRNAGFKVIDLGKDVSHERIVQEALSRKADIVALSALMSTTAPGMERVIKLLREKQSKAMVMVGGAVVTEDFAKAIGADGYGENAYEAVRVARLLVKDKI